MRNRDLLLAGSFVALLALGCGKKEAVAGQEQSPAPAASPAATEAKLEIDPETKKLFEAILASCKMQEGGGIDSCPSQEDQKLFDYARDKKPPHLVETIAEITVSSKEAKALAAAVGMLRWMATELDRDWLKQNATPAAAERMLKLVETADDELKYTFPEPAAAVILLAGKHADLDAALKKRKPESRLTASTYSYFADYGGVAVLPLLDALTKSPNEDLRYAATQAASIAMYRPKLSEEDQKKVCDWAKGYLAHDDEAVSAGAVDGMSRCKGVYIDAALDAFEARVGKGALGYRWAQVPHHSCWAEGRVGGIINGTNEQCKRALSLSDKALQSKELKGEPRRVVVFGIEMIAKNANLQTEAKPILQKYVADSESASAQAATDALKKL
jgi:hypothetical protein